MEKKSYQQEFKEVIFAAVISGESVVYNVDLD